MHLDSLPKTGREQVISVEDIQVDQGLRKRNRDEGDSNSDHKEPMFTNFHVPRHSSFLKDHIERNSFELSQYGGGRNQRRLSDARALNRRHDTYGDEEAKVELEYPTPGVNLVTPKRERGGFTERESIEEVPNEDSNV